MRNLITFLVFCCVAMTAHSLPADKFVPENAQDAAFHIDVSIEVAWSDGPTPRRISSKIDGAGFCISPDGYLATCKHVAAPLELLGQIIAQHQIHGAEIIRTTFGYVIANRDGMVFSTKYQSEACPITIGNSSAFGLEMKQLETRSGIQDEERNVQIIGGHETEDIILLKLNDAQPIPHIDLEEQIPFSETFFVLPARKNEKGEIKIARRPALYIEHTSGERNMVSLLATTYNGDSGSVVITKSGKAVGIIISNDRPNLGGEQTFMLEASTINNLFDRYRPDLIIPTETPIAPPPPSEEIAP